MVLMVVTYVDVMLQYQDSSGMELFAKHQNSNDKKVGRLIISHMLPRMIVMGGVETWKSYVVCHRSCLGKMGEDDLLIKRVNIFTGSRGTRGRLGVLLDNATDIDRDLVDESIMVRDDYGFSETALNRNLAIKGLVFKIVQRIYEFVCS